MSTGFLERFYTAFPGGTMQQDPRNGTVSEAGGALTLTVPSTADCRWENAVLNNAPLAWLKIHDLITSFDTVFKFESRCNNFTYVSTTASYLIGLIFHQDRSNLYWSNWWPFNTNVYVARALAGVFSAVSNVGAFAGPNSDPHTYRLYWNPTSRPLFVADTGGLNTVVQAGELQFWTRAGDTNAFVLCGSVVSVFSSNMRIGCGLRQNSQTGVTSAVWTHFGVYQWDVTTQIAVPRNAPTFLTNSARSPKDTVSLEDAPAFLSQGGPPDFHSPLGLNGAIPIAEKQPRVGFDDDGILPSQAGQVIHGFANMPNGRDEGYTLRHLLLSFEDAMSFGLCRDPEFSQVTQDVDLHAHFVYQKPYIAQYYDTSLDAWNTPTLNNFTGYGRDGYHYTNGVRTEDLRLVGVSVTGAKVYARHPTTGWYILSSQPTSFTSPGYLCIGVPGGGIVVWRGTMPKYCHYNPSTGVWTYKDSPHNVVGANGAGEAWDATHIYAWGSGRVEKFDGTEWTSLTPSSALSPAPDHGCVQAIDVLWVGARSYGSLFHYTGGVWTDRWAELVAGVGNIGGSPLTTFRDAWCYGSNVYILCHHSASSKCYLVKYNGTTWTLVGNGPNVYDLYFVWGTDDNHIWVSGRANGGSNTYVGFWNGTTWVTQLSGAATSGGLGPGDKLAGTGPLVLAASLYTTTHVVFETTNGSTWAAPSWPDSTPAVVFAATTFGYLYAPWRTESSGANRSSRPDFPLKSLMVVTQRELVIFDLDTYTGGPSSLRVWMRFLLANDGSNYYALGRGVESVRSIAYANGLLAVGTRDTGWENGRLHTIDFKANTAATTFSLIGSDGQWVGTGTKTIVDRNTTALWLASGSLRIAPESTHSLALLAEGTATHYLALAGEDPTPQLIKLVGNVIQSVTSAQGDDIGGTDVGNVRQVLFDDVGWLWFSVGSRLYRNCRDWREGHLWPDASDPRQGSVDLGTTITHLVAVKNDIYAGTAHGIYRIPKGSLQAYLAYTVAGGGGRGRLNLSNAGELLAGSSPAISSLRACTLLITTTVFGYLMVGTMYTLTGEGGFTLLRIWDDVVRQSFVSPNIIDPGTYISTTVLV